LFTGYLIDVSGWRSSCGLIGVLSVLLGIAFFMLVRHEKNNNISNTQKTSVPKHCSESSISVAVLLRVFAVIFFTTAIGGLIFQSTTFALPKIFDERLGDLASSATQVGWYAFIVFSVAAFAQLVVGYLLDNYAVRVVFASIACMQALFFALMINVTGLSALVVATAFMLVVFGQIPINDVLVGRMARSEWRSRAYAIRYIVSFSVMASAVPLIALVHSAWGFDALFILLSVAACCIFLATLFLPKGQTSSWV